MERRKCRDLGGGRRGQVAGTGWATGSDDDGSLPYSLECKYTARYGLRRAWVEQARRQGKADGRPWLIAEDEHNDRYGGIAVLAWPTLVELDRLVRHAYGGQVPFGLLASDERAGLPPPASTWTGTSAT
jgi:hypothetical protein